MNKNSNSYELGIKDNNGNVTTFNTTVHYNQDKPCAVVLTESTNNTGNKLSEISDKAMLNTANAVMKTHEKQLQGGDKIYVFVENDNGSYKQQPFEMQVKGSSYDQSAIEKKMSPYNKVTESDYKYLDSIHKDKMDFTISELQGKNSLAETKMPSINREKIQEELLQKH